MKSRVELLTKRAKQLLDENPKLDVILTFDKEERDQFSRLSLFYEGYEVFETIEPEVSGAKEIHEKYYIKLRKRKNV
jgi:hypothetical protein